MEILYRHGRGMDFHDSGAYNQFMNSIIALLLLAPFIRL
jgi:hypothetical protein